MHFFVYSSCEKAKLYTFGCQMKGLALFLMECLAFFSNVGRIWPFFTDGLAILKK